MSISKLFAEKSVVFSFEIFPPKRDSSIDTIWNTLEQLEGIHQRVQAFRATKPLLTLDFWDGPSPAAHTPARRT